MEFILGLLIGAVVGAAITYVVVRAAHTARHAGLATERDLLRERVVDLEAAIGDDQQTAAVLAPLGQALQRVEQQVTTLERSRAEQFGALGAQLEHMGRDAATLQQHTAELAGALRASSARGVWGELQLRRILEHSGMLAHCDFDEQVAAVSRHQARIRPDVVVRLPGDRLLVVDAKAPATAYLKAQQDGLDDDRRETLLRDHVKALERHVDALGGKEYWSAFAQSPQLVVCFVPSDAMLGAAMRSRPDLLERAMARHVVLASPSTLLAMLRATAFAWQQDRLGDNARELLDLGSTLYDRLATLGQHTTKLGASLRRSVESYNAMVGALESRVMVTARRMHDLGMADEAPARLAPVEAAPRPLTAAELIEALDQEVGRPELDLPREETGGESQRSEPAS